MKRSLEMPVAENARRERTYGRNRIYRIPVGFAGGPIIIIIIIIIIVIIIIIITIIIIILIILIIEIKNNKEYIPSINLVGKHVRHFYVILQPISKNCSNLRRIIVTRRIIKLQVASNFLKVIIEYNNIQDNFSPS